MRFMKLNARTSGGQVSKHLNTQYIIYHYESDWLKLITVIIIIKINKIERLAKRYHQVNVRGRMFKNNKKYKLRALKHLKQNLARVNSIKCLLKKRHLRRDTIRRC